MKYNFKQIFALGTSALLIGMTAMAGVGAANYPAPFVVSGQANVAVVYGTGSGVSATDQAQATLVASGLMGLVSGTTATVTGNAATLASGTDLLYLNDALNHNVQTITKDDLPVVLADGTFTDDAGTSYDYEQTISILGGGSFAFGNSDNDFDDPALMLVLTTAETTGLYNLTITFDDAIPFNESDSEGEVITLFGKTYTVATATTAAKLILLGGSDTETIQIGATATLTVGAESFSVTLDGISDASVPVASITVDGETKTFEEGQTKAYAGGDVDLFVKTIFRTGENAGHVEVQIGADKLTFEHGTEVQSGSDDDEIEGTLVYLAGGANAATKLTIAVAAPDNDENDVLVGESFIDPVFASVKINFASVANGPILVVDDDTSTTRNELEIEKGGNRELTVTATDASGNIETLPFTFENETADDTNTIRIWEGAEIAEDEYFILNSGNNQHFMQMTKVGLTAGGAATDDVRFKDLFSDNTYSKDNKDFTSGQEITIGGQTYTITHDITVSNTTVTVVSSDYGVTDRDTISVYPYIELVSGEDHRFAYTDEVLVLNDWVTGNSTGAGTITVTLTLPTGDVDVVTSATANNVVIGGTTIAHTADDSLQVGTVWYNFAVTAGTGYDGTANNNTDVTVAMDVIPGTGVGDVAYTAPALLFVEDEDKSESTTTTKNAVVLRTDDSGTYSTVLAPLFTGGSDTQTFDDTDFDGYLTNFGTYVLFDSSDTNQEFASLTYPELPMYADVYIAESGAVVSGDDIDSILVTDAEVSTVQTKNLVVIGGSCINSVAATLVGGSLCTTSWTTATEVGTGQFLIKSYANPYATGKVALLVAGYAMGDTVNAATYLRNIGVDTTVGKTYIGTTSTSATLQVA